MLQAPSPLVLLVLKVVLALGGGFAIWAFTYMGWLDRKGDAAGYGMAALFAPVYLFGLYGMMWWW